MGSTGFRALDLVNKIRFTKKALDGLTVSDKRERIRDTGVSGLILDLYPTGTKTFRVYKKIKGQTSPISITLGKFPDMSIENARKSAIEAINKLSTGVNPNEQFRAEKKSKITLREVYDDYVASRELSPSTIIGYQSVIKTYLVEYSDKPLLNITEEVVKREHAKITLNSAAQADLVMRTLRALFNYAKYEYRGLDNSYLFDQNPVQILSHQRQWNKVGRKNTRISISQLQEWFTGIKTVRAEGDEFCQSVCDLVEFALLTGLRRSELLSLTWAQVNLKDNTYYLDKTKNGDPLELPISSYIRTILDGRFRKKDKFGYVFNAPNEYGVIKEPKKVIVKIREESGIEFTLHDLRRTFTTTAESLNIGPYMIKRLLNHRTRRDDVTAGYIILTPEELRTPAQSIENKILEQAGVKPVEREKVDELQGLINGLSEVDKQKLLEQLSAGSS
jgi:integrase